MLQISKTQFLSTGVKRFEVQEGQSLDSILDEAYRDLRDTYTPLQLKNIKKYSFVTVDGVRIPRRAYTNTFPSKGSHIHIHRRVAGGGGGGGTKNILIGVAMVVAAVAISFFSFGTLTAPSMAALSASGIGFGGMAVAAGSSLLLAAGASLALSGLFAQPSPSLGGIGNLGLDAGAQSSAYAITGAENTLRPNETIPLILGTHRVIPPLGARNWTLWEGDEQFFHMLVVWGQADLDVEDIRIGDTPISNYKDIEINTVVTTGDNLKLFPKSRNENPVGAELNKSDGWVQRTVGEAEDISLEIQFNSLFSLDEDDGDTLSATVCFEAQYKKESDTEWTSVAQDESFTFEGDSLKVWAPKWGTSNARNGAIESPSTSNLKVYVSYDGKITAGESITGDIQLYSSKNSRVTGGNVSIVQEVKFVKDPSSPIYAPWYDEIPTGYVFVTVTAGSYAANTSLCYTNSNRDFKMYTLRINDLPKAVYEVRLRRTTADTDSQYIYDKATWAVMRAILNRPAFSSLVPVTVTELKIRASAQLSNYITNLNGLCHSKAPCWNGTGWEYKRTNNPASLARYLLTSEACLYEPYKESTIDDVDFVAAHDWARDNGYSFNFICDTQVLVWERLMQILSPARCAPTVDNNGKWGIIIDRADKEVKQMFTPRNSWGWQVSRSFYDAPHALRVTFVDSADNYTQKEIYVCNEGYTMDLDAEPTKKVPTDIRAYSYPGEVTYESVVRSAWTHLAKLMHRPISVTLNTDWEYIAVRRGDVVECSHSVLLNSYGDGKIIAMVFEDEDTGDEVVWDNPSEERPANADGDPLPIIGVQLDDTVIYDNFSVRYGLKIRYDSGKIGTFELDSPYNEFQEHKTLYFKYPVPASATPDFSNLCVVGDLDKEVYGKYIFAGANFSENFVAEMSLIPYAQPTIENAAKNRKVPPYVPPIILDVTQGKKLPTPSITAIKSNEDVLTPIATGVNAPTIKVWLQQGAGAFDTSKVYYQISAVKNGETTPIYAQGNVGQNSLALVGVSEKTLYTVRVRAVDMVSGATSDWSTALTHEVVGRTTPPPPPSAVYMSGNIVEIQQNNRPLDVVGHVVTVCMDEHDTIDMGVVVTNPYTTNGMFDISAWAGRARRIYVETIDELGLKSEAVSIVINLGDIIPDNVVLVISEFNKNWDGIIHNGFVNPDAYLSAGVNEYLFPTDNEAYLFPVDNDDFLFPTLTGTNLQYTHRVYISPDYIGGHLIVEPHAQTGRAQKIEYRIYQDAYLFPIDNEAYLFPVDDDGYLFPQNEPTNWVLMPDKLNISESFTIEIRVTSISQELTVFEDIVTIIDVLDKELILQDLDVLADGTTRIPIPQREFREITNIQGTLQYIEGNVGLSLEFVRGSEVYEDGFLKQGTLLRILDVNKQLTAGNADITVKGY